MLTRTRIVGLAIALAAVGSLVAGLAVVWNGQLGAPTAAGVEARPGASPSNPSRDNADAQPTAPGAISPPPRTTPTSGNAGNDPPNAEPTSASRPSASPRPTATSTSPSYYTIRNKAHNLCLNAMNHVDTAQVDVATCNGSWYQDWTGLKAGSAKEVINKESGLCLNAKSVANGADVDIATCNGSQNQLWLPDGAYLILSSASSALCLTGDSPATNESPAGAATCSAGTNQQWSW